MEHCIDIGNCLRIDLQIPSGRRCKLCRGYACRSERYNKRSKNESEYYRWRDVYFKRGGNIEKPKGLRIICCRLNMNILER
jgi:hypothetical protein